MIEADDHEFLELLGDLFGAHSRNVKADIVGGYRKGLKHMTLGEFRAVVEASIEKLQFTERGEARPPTVAELWDTHRQLKRKANGDQTVETEPKYNGDGWSVNGNLLLLTHVTRDGKPPELDYAPDGIHGEHTKAIAKILTRWMNAWVTDAREARADGATLDGRENWQHCMQRADDQVREYLAQHVRRQAAA